MGSVYRRKSKLWIRFKGEDGKWTQSKTPYKVGEERAARKLLVAVEDKIAAGEELGIEHEGPLTVDDFAKKWIKERRFVGVTDWENDERRLKLHVLPHIGQLPLDEVRPRHLVKLFTVVRAKLAPRTVRNVYSVVRALGACEKCPAIARESGPRRRSSTGLAARGHDRDRQTRGCRRSRRLRVDTRDAAGDDQPFCGSRSDGPSIATV